ncbi:MAG: HPF/RaiA family ribosome-associated protein, partial [Proteobacteria bacterium]|nr:HPF/RaiA family ribosome-associated protein [Pseudomonadota bacterium]
SVHENIYASIDLVAQKLEAQLARRKERRQHRMRPSASKNREFGLTKPTHIRFIEENEETSLDEWDLPQRSLMH